MILPWLVNVDKLGLKINIFDILDVMVLCFLIFFIKIRFQNIILLLFYSIICFFCVISKKNILASMILSFINFGYYHFDFLILCWKLYTWSREIWTITQIFFSLKDYMIFKLFVTTLIIYFIKIYLNFW